MIVDSTVSQSSVIIDWQWSRRFSSRMRVMNHIGQPVNSVFICGV